MSTQVNLSDVDRIVEETGRTPDAVIPILRKIQQKYNWLPEAALKRVCEITDITPAGITGVSTFYSRFRHKPAGRHFVNVCVGTACHVKGAEQVIDGVKLSRQIPEGQDTDPQGEFTVAKVACLGCCTLAPVVQIDDAIHGYLTSGTVGKTMLDFLERSKERKGPASRPHPRMASETGAAEIRIGQGSCCIASGSQDVRESLEKAVSDLGLDVRIKPVGCSGFCDQSPLLEVVTASGESTRYAKVARDEAARILQRHFRPQGFWNKARSWVSAALGSVVSDKAWVPVTKYSLDTRDPQVAQFLGKQKHIVTEHYGQMDPLGFGDYEAKGGFEALRKVLKENRPEAVVQEVLDSGLRGRGGGGFPTGRKWMLVRGAQGSPKAVVMNGDEGDPGAFMDRVTMECYPFRVLEGMTIAAFATGASVGYLYIRTEYPLAVERMQAAIGILRGKNLLGKNILGSGFDFEVKVKEGAGAFVCGEETALLHSIEGERGMPTFRPPYPAVKGVYGMPTLINNVETFACVPWILRNGAGAFAALGTEKSKGTKVFSLAGKVRRGGLIEVPMGITIREIVEDIGGGVGKGRTCKAVQIGGPSGGCIPASMWDTRVDYEELVKIGAMMGSGGLVVMDDQDCMVNVALYFMKFMQDESCGKCTPCRIGTKRMLDILERFCAGKARPGDLKRLEDMSGLIKQGSLCGLGTTAPNPVLTTLKYFRQEYEAHEKGVCPAKKCLPLIRYTINEDCIGCTRCAQACPTDAIAKLPYRQHSIDLAKCVSCDMCNQACPVDAVQIVHAHEVPAAAGAAK
jgi:NADH:ubiquinone oxidoreductase subunit F (NADH-binding)/NADH:ubiquinone oxidoreductase subunit E/Pyruvate/2-oxoacid:ferredoxin oxidoreductase delta subunit